MDRRLLLEALVELLGGGRKAFYFNEILTIQVTLHVEATPFYELSDVEVSDFSEGKVTVPVNYKYYNLKAQEKEIAISRVCSCSYYTKQELDEYIETFKEDLLKDMVNYMSSRIPNCGRKFSLTGRFTGRFMDDPNEYDLLPAVWEKSCESTQQAVDMLSDALIGDLRGV